MLLQSSSSDTNYLVSNSIHFTTVSCSFSMSWHTRLGHPNDYTLKLILNQCNIPHSNKSGNSLCFMCCVAKSHCIYAPISQIVYHTPLELVYIYLWGTSPMQSINDFSYFISFVGVYSHFTWIYLLKQKFDALIAFKHLKSMVES
uniref:Retrovirus-related Pol polyprotein from transposon TNT 1-94 n=1 Tax=Cajanus cajan TaxID=3821 RepID=A0A151TEW6_CAJCA|nr:Retrovirus-related Pol polyprotein from transposon TNT 1-94 [Cajanus cajan]